MVVWDKYLEIVQIDVTTFVPPVYSFSITHKFLFPDSTILAGFLSNSLLYQVSPLGVRLYSATTFDRDLAPRYESK
jgi:hypothetical protein